MMNRRLCKRGSLYQSFILATIRVAETKQKPASGNSAELSPHQSLFFRQTASIEARKQMRKIFFV
jgi:hypothetical protein